MGGNVEELLAEESRKSEVECRKGKGKGGNHRGTEDTEEAKKKLVGDQEPLLGRTNSGANVNPGVPALGFPYLIAGQLLAWFGVGWA